MIGIKPERGQRLIDGEFINGLAGGQNFEYAAGIIAHAGGGQANATPLPIKSIIEVDTVATADDSVSLPVSDAGMRLTVINATANSMNLYASPLNNGKNGGAKDTINGVANATAYAIAAGLTVTFVCASPGKWFALKSA